MLVKFFLGIWPDWEFYVFFLKSSVFLGNELFFVLFFVFLKFYNIKKFCLSVYKNELSVICYFANPLSFVINIFCFFFFFCVCFYGVSFVIFFSFFFLFFSFPMCVGFVFVIYCVLFFLFEFLNFTVETLRSKSLC